MKLERPIWGCWPPLTMLLGELSTILRGPMLAIIVDNSLAGYVKNNLEQWTSFVWHEMCRMTYKEEGRERTIFDDTVIIFTSTNGALTPQVQYWGKKNLTKTQHMAESWSRRWVKQAPERQPGRPAGGGNQDSCLCLKFGQGFPENKQSNFLPVSTKLYLEQASGTMKSLFHIADWLPTIVQGVAGGQVSFS